MLKYCGFLLKLLRDDKPKGIYPKIIKLISYNKLNSKFT